MGAFTGMAPVGFPNVALSNFMKEFRNNQLVGELAAPRVPVERQSFPYVIFDRSGQRFGPVDAARAWHPAANHPHDLLHRDVLLP